MEHRVDRLTAEGFAVVLQNIRGRLGSEGERMGTASRGEDGYDTIEWIAGQSWCSGAVGTFGGSALAKVQMVAAFLAHPAHRAMCPQVLPFGMNSRLGGAYMFSQMPQWLYFTQSGNELQSYEEVDWMPHLWKLPVVSVLDELEGGAEIYRQEVTNPKRNSWGRGDPEVFADLNTANLMVTGWQVNGNEVC
jgi:predicted acyl esterase